MAARRKRFIEEAPQINKEMNPLKAAPTALASAEQDYLMQSKTATEFHAARRGVVGTKTAIGCAVFFAIRKGSGERFLPTHDKHNSDVRSKEMSARSLKNMSPSRI